VLQFDTDIPQRAKRAKEVELDFSPTADVFWTFEKGKGRWVRSYDTGPALLENDHSISATNVVVQIVKLKDTGIVDAAGNPSPEVVATGSGQCLIFRNGRVVKGMWSRPTLDDLTVYRDAKGNEIKLEPGTTWIELYPDTAPAPATS
jgi:hypothetical protein